MFELKGAFALFLGSGISSAAKILIGWEIARDMIQELKTAAKDDAPLDPFQWFEDKYQLPASYSNILEQLDPTQGGRAGILARYFEPTPEDRDEGRKVPTEAHQ